MSEIPLFRLSVIWLLAGCATSYNVATERHESLFMDTDQEIRMGESVAKHVEEDFDIIRDPDLLARVDRVGQRISDVADRRDLSYRFAIVEEKESEEQKQPNAFALPGGFIYVTTGLLDLAKSDDELAAVIAHEVGHVVARHAVKRLQGGIGLQLLQLLAIGAGPSDPRSRQSLDLALASIFTAYSQEDEMQADRLSVRYLKRAGYQPSAAIRFMTRLRDYTFKQPLRRHSYFRTHPYFSDRVRILRQESEGQLTFDDYINTQ